MSSVYCPVPGRPQSRSKSSKRWSWFFFCRLFFFFLVLLVFFYIKREGKYGSRSAAVHGFEDKVEQGRVGGNWWDRNITSKKKITPLLGVGGCLCKTKTWLCGVQK